MGSNPIPSAKIRRLPDTPGRRRFRVCPERTGRIDQQCRRRELVILAVDKPLPVEVVVNPSDDLPSVIGHDRRWCRIWRTLTHEPAKLVVTGIHDQLRIARLETTQGHNAVHQWVAEQSDFHPFILTPLRMR